MEHWERDLYVARICSGSVRCTARDHRGRMREVLIKRASRDEAYRAAEIFRDVYCESQEAGLYDEDALYDFLVTRGLWDETRQSLLDKLPKEIDEFKLALYRAGFKSGEKVVIRKALDAARTRLAQVIRQRHAYDHLSCSGTAAIARSRYLVGRSLFLPGGRPVFGSGDDFWEQPSVLLDNVLAWQAGNRLSDGQFRELARTEPWRSLWACRKVEGSVFGVPPTDYTDEQKSLVTWSVVYDNAYQHPQCPADEVLDDDDLFDGWMIERRLEREQGGKKTSSEDVLSERMRGHEHVFMVAGDEQEAEEVMGQNDEHARRAQRQRFAHLREKGVVDEMEMPDTKQRFRMEVAKMFGQALKG